MSKDDPRQAVLDAIPHRPPFLFVDQVLELEERRILARVEIDPEAAFFAGHYPGNPIMPGVLVSEAVFQAAAILVGSALGADALAGRVPVLVRIKDARYRQPVFPGATLELEVELTDQLSNVYHFKGRARTGGKDALRIEFACALAEPLR